MANDRSKARDGREEVAMMEKDNDSIALWTVGAAVALALVAATIVWMVTGSL